MSIAIVSFNYPSVFIRDLRCLQKPLFGITYYPISMVYLGTLLNKYFDSIKIIDGNVSKVNFKELTSYKYIIVFTSPQTILEDLKTISSIKQNNQKYILYGLIPHFFKREIIEKYGNSIDFIPDLPFEDSILDYILAQEKKLITTKKIEETTLSKRINRALNQFSKTTFNWDLIDIKNYNLNFRFFRIPFAQIVTGKGCRYNCDFCVVPYIYRGNHIKKDIENVFQEIFYFYSKGVRFFQFFDEDFLMSERSQLLLNKIIEKNLKIRFLISTRFENLNENIIKKLKKAGCIMISVGIESFNDAVLTRMNKRKEAIDLNSLNKYCKMIPIHGHFVFGYEKNETELFETISKILKSDLTLISIYPATPFPGSKLFEKIKLKFEEIYNCSYENNIRILDKHFQDLQRKIYLKFYFSFKRLKLLLKFFKIALLD